MIESGFLVFLGVFLLLLKLPRRVFLWLLGHDLVLDVAVTLFTLSVHFGTFSGVMAACVAGLLTSLTTTALKRCFGSIKRGVYRRGYFALSL
jgi:NhaP-type Na+/H+ or K+/H+ antiporter